MKCRKCKEYGWNDPQEALAGEEYCIFHTPKEDNYEYGGMFNRHFSKRIERHRKARVENNVCIFTGTQFPPNFEFVFGQHGKELPAIRFQKCKFMGPANFSGAKFVKSATFIDSTFCSDALFVNADFGGEAYFVHIDFIGEAYFSECKFNKRTDFTNSTIHSQMSFISSEFGGFLSFGMTKGSGVLSFNRSGFNKVSFLGSNFKKINFENADFRKKSTFEDTFFESASFRSITAEKGLVFRNIKPLNAWFPYTKMDNIRFEDCEWKTENDKENGRICVSLEDEKLTHAEDFYRRMKQKYKNENHESEASRWHLAEKEVYRKRLRGDKSSSRFLRIALWLYRWSSGYGEDPWRAFLVLLLVILLPFFYFSFAKSWIMNLSFLPDGGECKAILQDVYSFFPLTKVDQSVLEGNVFEVAIRPFWKLLVAAQAALLAFALRNKFRR